MKTKEKLDWTQVQVNFDDPKKAKAFAATDLGKAWVNYRAALDVLTEARKPVEKALIAKLAEAKMIPEGMEPRIGYNFGGLAFALAPKTPTKLAGTSKGKLSFI